MEMVRVEVNCGGGGGGGIGGKEYNGGGGGGKEYNGGGGGRVGGVMVVVEVHGIDIDLGTNRSTREGKSI
ncbi:hypothetical protein Pmani_038204 [Petrolisthes manimaculis]|uniref:Uncharacterized protein n=1 Tax=Petrolisthes manimaculis TaxID=1843537 RepID=A0AAE1NEV8_9EUCA|nr:hypothetical protein Pmani_038204 [Petrolisthes manimaculis]